MKKFLTIRKIALFYETYDDDAQILSYLLGYKIIKGRVGFPENAIHKVINTLDSGSLCEILDRMENMIHEYE